MFLMMNLTKWASEDIDLQKNGLNVLAVNETPYLAPKNTTFGMTALSYFNVLSETLRTSVK